MSGFTDHTALFRAALQTHYTAAFPADLLAWPNEADPTEGGGSSDDWLMELDVQHFDTEDQCAGPDAPERTVVGVSTFFYNRQENGVDGFSDRANEVKGIWDDHVVDVSAGVEMTLARYINPRPSGRKTGWRQGGLTALFEIEEAEIGGTP